jgi:hypothetical protein
MAGADPRPSCPQDWAFLDPAEYFGWHREFGNNVAFCQAYTFCGYAFYPSKLGPLAPGPGSQLLPALLELAREADMPFWSYFCVGSDLIMKSLRKEWTVPDTMFLAPESPWTDLLCQRIREFLSLYPVDWILFDWFVYGGLDANGTEVRPFPFAGDPFREIIGREIPDTADGIAPEEHLAYKREILARQFHAIRAAVKDTSPRTKMIFNVPYREARGDLWADHPMLRESEGLFSECTDTKVMEWLLSIRRPGQRVMTTIRGHAGEGLQGDPRTWRKWYDLGCDFMGYAWGTPPDFRPHPKFDEELGVIREAFGQIP